MAPPTAGAWSGARDREQGYDGLALDDDGADPGEAASSGGDGAIRGWQPRLPMTVLFTTLLGVIALAVCRSGGLLRIEPSAAEAKQAVYTASAPAQAQAGVAGLPAPGPQAYAATPAQAPAAEQFTCAKYGCLDVKSMNACRCDDKCVTEGGCCPDYQAVCKNPARHSAALGRWDGCPPGAVPTPPGVEQYVPKGAPLQVRVMSFNVEWWHLIEQLGGGGNSAAKLIVQASHPVPFDFIGFQEFYDPWFGLTRPGFDASELLRDYMFVRGEVGGPVGSIIAFRNATWSLISKGQRFVAKDRPGPMYFGKRIALWARFSHKATGKTVFFMNHHGPLPVNTGGVCGGPRTAFNLLQMIAQNAKPGDAIIFTGDFNAAANSPTIQTLSSRLHNSFSGIDHIFTNLGPAAVKSQGALGKGGSDHDAISVVLELAGAQAAAV